MAGGDDAPTIPGIDGLELVGRGGFAVVYRGHQPAFRRDVAVKVLQRSGLDEDDRRRFDRECQAMGTLSDHPAIATLYDAGFTADGRPYLVMAYVRDGTLGDVLAADGPLSWEQVAALGVRLAGALETAHLAGVLHRDIKPANVLRGPYGAQLTDFGIARIAGAHETRSGVITASVAHAAPEILDGQSPTFQADVYGLGSTLFEALTGRPAFVRDTDEGLLPLIRRVVTEDPPDLREQGVPDPVAGVVETSMAKDPADRYATAREFGLAMRGAQAVLGVSVTDLVVVRPHTAAPTVATEPSGAGADPVETDRSPTEADRPPADRPTADATTDLGGAAAGAAAGASAGAGLAGAETTTITAGPTDPPTTSGGPGRREDDHPRRGRTGLLAVGVVLAVVALVIGLLTLTGGDPEPTVDPDPTAVGGTSPEIDTTLVPSTEAPATSDPTVTDETVAGTAAPATTTDAGGSDLHVGVVAPGAAPDHPLLAGVQRAADDVGLAVAPNDPQAPPDEAIFDLVSAGQDTIVVLAEDPFRQAAVDAVVASAEAHPEVHYIVLGAAVEAPNVASFPFADHEGSYLVGAAAGFASGGRVGFIGGGDTPAVRQYEAGFVAGVRDVAPTTQVDVRSLADGEPMDNAAVAALAAEMYEAGADVIYHAGVPGAGLFATAAATGNRAIGVDTDEAASAAPEVESSILTSMVRPYDAIVHDALIAADQGNPRIGVNVVDVSAGVTWAPTGGHVDEFADELTALAEAIITEAIVVPTEVERRALAPLGADCPPEGCLVRIIGAEPSGAELLLTLEANWVLDTGGEHAHYFFSPRYSAEQAGGDSAERFGVEVGDWDLDDSYPQYLTEGSVSLSQRGSDSMICVTAADSGHNVVDPANFDCVELPPAG